MQFLKTLFWVVLAVAAVIFAMRNWNAVTINLWAGMLVDAKLPVLIFGALLLGFLPTFLYHCATRWQLKRRIDSHERVIAEMRDASETGIIPSRSSPTIEPPAQS